MTYRSFLYLLFLVVATWRFPVHSQISFQDISFDDLVPSGYGLTQCWDHIGIDDQERVYIGFTANAPGGVEDVVLFRYDPSDGGRTYLGTFIGIAQDATNYQSGESIPKGHTHIVNVDGTMYMGSQGFHDFKQAIDALPTFRGAHVFTYETGSGVLADATAGCAGGVAVEHEGIIALSYGTWQNQIACLTHPHSDILLFDVQTQQVARTIKGIPWSLGNPLSREIVLTPSGKIYTYRGTEDPSDSDQSFEVYECDLSAGIDTVKPTGFHCSQGFWDGQTVTRDGNHVYVSTVQGMLYHLDVQSDTWEPLGHLLPQSEYDQGARHQYLYGISLSPDETGIVFVASVATSPAASGNVYEYEISSATVSLLTSISHGHSQCYCGSDTRDSRGNVYFARFGTSAGMWSGDCRLLKLDLGTPVSSTHGPSATPPSVRPPRATQAFTIQGRALPRRRTDLREFPEAVTIEAYPTVAP